MYINLFFSLTSIFFLILLLRHFVSRAQFPSLSNQCYRYLLALVLVYLIFDVLAAVSANYAAALGFSWLAYFCNTVFYLLQLAVPCGITIYFFILISPGRSIEKKEYLMLMAPMLAMQLALLGLTPFGLMFRITAQAGFERGFATLLCYLGALIYFIICCVLSIKNKDYVRDNCRATSLVVLAIAGVAMLIQFIFPSQHLMGTAASIGMLLFFLNVQNPEGYIDDTTQLLNYNAYVEILTRSLLSKDPTHVIFMDVFGLRHVNSVLGTAEGDDILKSLGKEIFHDNEGWFCRIAGTRFAIITNNEKVFSRNVRRLTNMTNLVLPTDVESGKAEFKLVVACMHNAHQYGSMDFITKILERAVDDHNTETNEGVVFMVGENEADKIIRKSELEESLKRCVISREGFSVFYQPIYNPERHVFCRAEALLRFEHPQLGFIAPAEFLPIIEKCGLSTAVDNMVVDTVFSDISNGMFMGLGYDYIAINLTASIFASSQTSKFIDKAKSYHIDPSMVCFEISEHVASISNIDFRTYMLTLKTAGFNFALDDFGSGYSNIARLLTLPFSSIKLSKKLLDSAPAAYVELVSTIKRLNLAVVAMGVENEEQFRTIKYCKADLCQGFAYGRPVRVSELSKAPLFIKDYAK